MMFFLEVQRLKNTLKRMKPLENRKETSIKLSIPKNSKKTSKVKIFKIYFQNKKNILLNNK